MHITLQQYRDKIKNIAYLYVNVAINILVHSIWHATYFAYERREYTLHIINYYINTYVLKFGLVIL